MAYFLKKTQRKNGLYLQIYESFHDPEKGYARHKCIKSVGYEPKLREAGIDNPVEYYSNEVKKMNKKRKADMEKSKIKLISENPVKNLGYFLPKAVMNKLKIEKELQVYKLAYNFQFDVYKMLEALIYSRIIEPVSKYKSWSEIIPTLYEDYNFSLDQIYAACEFFGEEYERIIEVFNHQIMQMYSRKTKKVYFDCTNFYFEIDYEYQDKQKGPSKENQNSPIIGMALMLDENQIPIGMKMYPGNESEKPKLRNMIHDLKQQNNIKGKTIQVADKGLNCGDNIYQALKEKDGYIFSKSVKMLPATEKAWITLDNDQWQEIKKEDSSLRFKYKECVDNFTYERTDENGHKIKFTIPEKRIVTFNPDLQKKQLIEINRLIDKAMKLSTSKAKKGEYGESAKYVNFTAVNKKTGEISNDDAVTITLNTEKLENDKILAGYNLLVTSELKMPASEVYHVYHNLWKIEESFRIMKGQLNARPVYLHKQYSIYGHFLICYLAVTILRILQYVEFSDKICCNKIVDFVRDFQCIKDDKNITNISTLNKIKAFNDVLNLNLTNFYLTEKNVNKILSFAF